MESANLLDRISGYKAKTLKRFPNIPHYIAVARLDRPIGIYLLLWPTLWGLWFAASGWPGLHLFLVFTLGTVLTRSAGCVINDIADRKFDGQVKRTRDRPLARGDLSVEAASVFMFVMLFIALLLVLSTNVLTVTIAFLATVIAGIYPFMKRYTYMPQAILGLAFSCGIPMAFAAHDNEVPTLAWLLVTANVVWTVAYDTEYAMVDRDDDLKLGLRSSAILFGDIDKVAIGSLQVLFIFILWLVGARIEATLPYYIGIAGAALLLVYQQYLIRARDRELCFRAFLNNHWAGLAIFAGIVGHFLMV